MFRTFTITTISTLSLSIMAVPATAQVVQMDARSTSTCQYVQGQLVCNIDAVQTFANGREISGMYAFNCETGLLAVLNPVSRMNGAIDNQFDGWSEAWQAETPAELNFVSEKCYNFEVLAGGSDGLLADPFYKFEYSQDGRLTCRDTRDSSYHDLQRCFDAAGFTGY